MKPFVFISRNRYYLNDRSRSSHINETETIQIIEKNSTQIIDHEIVQTIDQTTTIVTVNHVLTPEIEIITTQIEKEIILSHHTEITNNIQFHKKNYRSSTPKHQRQMNQVQATEKTQSDPPAIDNTKNSELHLNHIYCQSTDDESETETCFKLKMNTKHQLIRIFTKTKKASMVSKNQTTEKSQQIILNKKLKKVET